MTATAETETKARTATLTDIEAIANQIRDQRRGIRDLQGTLDERVAEARRLDITYREIAETAGRSVAWVQSALLRTGAIPVGRD